MQARVNTKCERCSVGLAAQTISIYFDVRRMGKVTLIDTFYYCGFQRAPRHLFPLFLISFDESAA